MKKLTGGVVIKKFFGQNFPDLIDGVETATEICILTDDIIGKVATNMFWILKNLIFGYNIAYNYLPKTKLEREV